MKAEMIIDENLKIYGPINRNDIFTFSLEFHQLDHKLMVVMHVLTFPNLLPLPFPI